MITSNFSYQATVREAFLHIKRKVKATIVEDETDKIMKTPGLGRMIAKVMP